MSDTVVCKNCGNIFSGKYCNNCGEKVYTEKDRSVKHILSEGLHFLTHFDGTFFNSFLTLFKQPGKFSLDYCNGIRKRYFKPLGFFLLLVVLYLLFPLFDGLNEAAYYHVRSPLYGKYAMKEALKVVHERHLTDAEFGEAFRHASGKISKFLLFIIIPAMAFFSWLISFKKRKYFYDHFVFSIEANSFFILWAFLIFPLLFRITYIIIPALDKTPGVAILFTSFIVFIFFLVIASKRFFGFNWLYSVLYSLLFTFILAMFIQYIYKFILFFITIHVM